METHCTDSELPVEPGGEPPPGGGNGQSRARPHEGLRMRFPVPSPRPPLPENQPERSATSTGARAFRRRHFPAATPAEWNDWRWQLRKRIRSLEVLERIVTLTPDERQVLEQRGGHLPLGITPYYAHLLAPDDPGDPLRRSVIPVGQELLLAPGEAEDPLAEDRDSPVPGIVHRYPDRVLFLVTDFCSVYCRYCTRSRMVGGGGKFHFGTTQWEAALQYIEMTPTIRDVLISGGDPLTLADDRLEYLLQRLRLIPHVEFLRIGTKVPVVLPQRITPALVRLLKRYQPLWMSLNFMHPAELTAETAQACTRLANAGIPLGSQTVLMAGINDNTATLRKLFHGLLKIRVRPYYLYQCDPIQGSAHFRTPVSRGLEIIQQLRGHTTGYAVPLFIIDAPGGGGKIHLTPDAVVRRDQDGWILKNYEGGAYFYPDPETATPPVVNPAAGVPIRPPAPRVIPGGRVVGLTYDLRSQYLAEGYGEEETAEFDSEETVAALESTLRELGHHTDRIGHARDLLKRLAGGDRWDLVFNLAEGLYGYGRESLVPSILDAYRIPYTFSDPLVLSLSLHKGLTKRTVRDLGIPTPEFAVVENEHDLQHCRLPFPLFVKPVAEGTGKGITARSRVTNRPELEEACRRIWKNFHQAALVEVYLGGDEFTVGIVGSGERARVIGETLQVQLLEQAEAGSYTYLNKEHYEQLVTYRLVKDGLGLQAGRLALQVWRGLGCRDGGRVDLRADTEGKLYFLEVNPLAGLHPRRSDLPILCSLAGIPYRQLIAAIMESALERIPVNS